MPLADDDVAGDYLLAAEFLDSEALSRAIASVLTGSLSFFMGHVWKISRLKGLGLDGVDLDD